MNFFKNTDQMLTITLHSKLSVYFPSLLLKSTINDYDWFHTKKTIYKYMILRNNTNL